MFLQFDRLKLQKILNGDTGDRSLPKILFNSEEILGLQL